MARAGSASQPAPIPVVSYDNRYTMAVRPSVGRQIRRVSLISLASVTHAFNQNQTFVWLPVVSTGPLTTQVQLPANENVAPPGFYMMFAVDDAGIPSEGHMVKLTAGTFRSPTLTEVHTSYDAVVDPSEVYAGDNIYLGGSDGLSSTGQNSLTVEVETIACQGKFRIIEVNSEARMSRLGTRTRQLWNWLTEEWVTVGSSEITTQDTLASHEINVGTDFGEYMNARDRRVRARLIFTSDAPFNLWMDMVEFGFR